MKIPSPITPPVISKFEEEIIKIIPTIRKNKLTLFIKSSKDLNIKTFLISILSPPYQPKTKPPRKNLKEIKTTGEKELIF